LLLDGDEQPTDLRAGRQAELVAPEQRLVRVVLARRLYLGREFGRADERERLERPRLGDPAEAVDRAGRAVGRPLRPEERAQEPLRQRREPEAELVLQADGAQEAERVVLEDRLRDRAQAAELDVLEPAARVDDLAPAERPRERVHGEVARREVALDRPPKRREVDCAAVVERDPPRAV